MYRAVRSQGIEIAKQKETRQSKTTLLKNIYYFIYLNVWIHIQSSTDIRTKA
jgi:hypothetical protein